MNTSAQFIENDVTFPIPDSVPKEWSNYRIILTIVLALITITTIFANSIVLYLFFNRAKQRLRSPTHYLLANMAVADLLVGLVVMPPLLTLTVSDFTWYWGDFFCSIFDYIHFPLCANSMLSVIGVVTERYIGVKYPLQHLRIMTKCRVLKFIALIWILAIALTAIPLTVWPVLENKVAYICFLHLREPFAIYVTCAIYWVPVNIMIVLYWVIFRNATKPFGPVKSSIPEKSALEVKRRKSNESKFLKARQRQTNLTKKMSIFVAVVLLMFGPLFVVFLLRGINSPYFSIQLFCLMGWLRYSNSTINPFLYTFAVPGYKAEFYRIFLNEKSSQNKNDGDISSEDSDDENNSNYPLNAMVPISYSELEFRPMVKSQQVSEVSQQEDSNVNIESPSVSSLNQRSEDVGNGLPVISEPLMSEIQNFLQAISDKNTNKDRITGDIVRDRGSKLMTNLLHAPQKESFEKIRNDDTTNAEKIRTLRKSVVAPIMERRSEIIQTSKDREHDIDWDVIRGLDEIIEMVENNIIKPLNFG